MKRVPNARVRRRIRGYGETRVVRNIGYLLYIRLLKFRRKLTFYVLGGATNLVLVPRVRYIRVVGYTLLTNPSPRGSEFNARLI